MSGYDNEAPSSPRSAAIYYWGGHWDNGDEDPKDNDNNGVGKDEFYWEEVKPITENHRYYNRNENGIADIGSNFENNSADSDGNHGNHGGDVIWDTTQGQSRRRRHVVRIQQRFHLAMQDEDDETHWLVCPYPKAHAAVAPKLPTLDEDDVPGEMKDQVVGQDVKEGGDDETKDEGTKEKDIRSSGCDVARNKISVEDDFTDPSDALEYYHLQQKDRNAPKYSNKEEKALFKTTNEQPLDNISTDQCTSIELPNDLFEDSSDAKVSIKAESSNDSRLNFEVKTNNFSKEFTSIPIVDLSLPKEQYAAQIGDACRNVGFFYVINHGVGSELTEGVMEYGKRFFRLPLEEKMKLMGGDAGTENEEGTGNDEKKGYRGYFGVGMEDLEGKDGTRDLMAEEGKSGDNEKLGCNGTIKPTGDFKEGFDLGIEDIGKSGDIRGEIDESLNFFGKNQWPDESKHASVFGFRKMMSEYQTVVLQLADKLLVAFATSLDDDGGGNCKGGITIPEDYFIVRSRNPMCTLRLLHYPPNDNDRNRSRAKGKPGENNNSSSGCGAHTDYGLFTILLQQHDIGGLQVRNRSHQWIDAPPLKGSFVINVGDMLSWWTGGRYSSTVHRVISPSSERVEGTDADDQNGEKENNFPGHRYSVPFFFNPDHDAVVKPLINGYISSDEGGEGTYKTAVEILQERYAGTFQNTKN